MRRLRFSVFVLLVVGCAEPEVVDTLRSCDLLTEGYLRELPVYAPTECYRECLGAASCAELEQALCRTDLDLLITCDRRCAFECASGALLAVESVCDGFDDCESGEDEARCPVHVCDDGTELVGEHRCDGWPRCPDGSDEVGCPLDCERGGWPDGCPGYECANGQLVAPSARCNRYPECFDESDEVGCAELVLMCE